MARPRIDIPYEKVADFCRRHSIRKLSLFDSVLRDDFGPESDVDVLVEFEPGSRHTLFDLVRMEQELQDILGQKMDLVDRRAIEESRNYIRRENILRSLHAIYAAR
jgi:predicted nucleotidyltransferase